MRASCGWCVPGPGMRSVTGKAAHHSQLRTRASLSLPPGGPLGVLAGRVLVRIGLAGRSTTVGGEGGLDRNRRSGELLVSGRDHREGVVNRVNRSVQGGEDG